MYADCLPGARVEVQVNNESLAEHATENDAVSATTFVEVVAGASFTVVLHIEAAFAYRNPTDRVSFGLHLDGEWASSLVVDPKIHFKSTHEFAIERVGNTVTQRRFLFAELETSTSLPIVRYGCGLHANTLRSRRPKPFVPLREACQCRRDQGHSAEMSSESSPAQVSLREWLSVEVQGHW